MRPVHEHGGYVTFDLTACVVHALTGEDGTTRIVAMYPKKWVAHEKQTMRTVGGQVLEHRPYTVTEWHEVILATAPAQ